MSYNNNNSILIGFNIQEYILKKIIHHLQSISEGGLNIFVTYDFHTIIFRFGWFGLPPDDRWIDFLGGFAFSIMEDHILLLDYGKLIKLGIPYWWKNREI